MKRKILFYLIGGLFLFSSIGTGTAQTAESPASAPPSSGTGTAQTAESPA
ncbi:MAG: hypothetical protein HY201_02260, partial [Nitrospirae bacterium]|nr:hypothetical protein [Candidatus Troglogloeales bacterium]